jgi:hypothetical protein
MEAQFAADLREGALTVTERDIRVTLALTTGTAEPRLTVVKGDTKRLKALPAKLKKQAQIAALLARKREVEQQLSRMRSSGVAAVIISSSLRGEPWQKSTSPSPKYLVIQR